MKHLKQRKLINEIKHFLLFFIPLEYVSYVKISISNLIWSHLKLWTEKLQLQSFCSLLRLLLLPGLLGLLPHKADLIKKFGIQLRYAPAPWRNGFVGVKPCFPSHGILPEIWEACGAGSCVAVLLKFQVWMWKSRTWHCLLFFVLWHLPPFYSCVVSLSFPSIATSTSKV